MTDHDPNRKGNVAELAIAAEAARLGLSVCMPLTEHGRCDLVIGIGGELRRIQCKWARKRGDVIDVNLLTSRRSASGYVRSTYSADEVDAIGAYCEELDSCYLIPIDEVEGRSGFRLRLAPARNGQRAALNLAEHYRLGAVAQLAERRHGMAEARGSNPLSSTSSDSGDSGTQEVVGAHEFRNHFGYFLERARGGTEVQVERRGKPYATLGPPTLKP